MPRINKALYPHTEKFKNVRSEFVAMGEVRAACAPRAICLATGAAPEKVIKMLAARGRKKETGTWTRDTIAVLDELGYAAKRVSPRSFIKRYPIRARTLKHVTTHHPDRFSPVFNDGKTYLFETSGHILCVIDGIVHDHNRGRRYTVTQIFEIVKK